MNTLNEWITGDWRQLMPAVPAAASLSVIAALCGAIVGTERERREKPTGTRTLALVSLGACIFTILSAHLGNRDGHIAANIISGIGFLGASIIIHGRYGVAGLTSAATIWTVAAVGMTVGAGYACPGLVLSLFVFVMLGLVRGIERRFIDPCRFSELEITYDPAGGKTLVKIEESIDEFDAPGMRVLAHAEAGTAKVRYCTAHKRHREFLARLAEMPEVMTITRDTDLQNPARQP